MIYSSVVQHLSQVRSRVKVLQQTRFKTFCCFGRRAPFVQGCLPPVIAPETQPSASPDAISIGKVSAVKLKQKKK